MFSKDYMTKTPYEKLLIEATADDTNPIPINMLYQISEGTFFLYISLFNQKKKKQKDLLQINLNLVKVWTFAETFCGILLKIMLFLGRF
jgi:hypothetical protein